MSGVEGISGIITLTNASLAIIQRTVTFIQQVQRVHRHIRSLMTHLLDLAQLLEMMETTINAAMDHDENWVAFVREKLIMCKKRLQEVRTMVTGLATQNSDNVFQTIVLTIQTNLAGTAIDEAIRDIDRYKDCINQAMVCWTTQMVSDIRRTSEAPPVQAPSLIGAGPQPNIQHMVAHSRQQTWSESETLLDSELSSPGLPTPPSRSTSSNTQHSRYSISLTSSRADPMSSHQYDRTSIHSGVSERSSEWESFRCLITKCGKDEAQLRAIETTLEQHPGLANYRDVCNRTPLHLAAQHGNVGAARKLCKHGANIDAQDSEPCSVLDHAIAYNKQRFVAFLLEEGVNEFAISKKNRTRLVEMKEAIALRKRMSVKQGRKS